MNLTERVVTVKGHRVRYLAAGSGPALVLLHGLGESPADWSAVLPRLSPSRSVYAPALPGFDGEDEPADVSAEGYARFLGQFLDAVGVERAAVVGHSLGGLVGLLFTLASPGRVTALCLVGSGGLGREISPTLAAMREPVLGELGAACSRTQAGAAQRAWSKALLLFGRPWLAPAGWLSEQYRLARRPGFLDNALAALRNQVGPTGQRRVLLGRLGDLRVPVLLVRGGPGPSRPDRPRPSCCGPAPPRHGGRVLHLWPPAARGGPSRFQPRARYLPRRADRPIGPAPVSD